MANNQPQLNPLQEQLKLMRQCPVCKSDYDTKQAKIMEEKGSACLVHITCPQCFNSVLAVVVTSQIGMSSVGMVTDLVENDVRRLRQKESITEEELLDFHTLLKDNHLNFKLTNKLIN